MENERPTPLVDDIEGTRARLEIFLMIAVFTKHLQVTEKNTK